MLPLERRQNIVEQIAIDRSVRVINLSEKFHVTEETIRRDLEKLEKQGILKRTYGGAVIVEGRDEGRSEEVSFMGRSKKNIESKIGMGQKVSEIVQDGDLIMMDSSTTSLEVAKKLINHKDLTIITNSMAILTAMVQYNKVNTVCTGGSLHRNALAFSGPIATKNINNYYADKVILSCKSMDMEKGIMEPNDFEADVKRAMIGTAEVVILVVDHTKFDRLSVARLYDFSIIDFVVTDIEPSEEWMEFFDKMGIECVCCG